MLIFIRSARMVIIYHGEGLALKSWPCTKVPDRLVEVENQGYGHYTFTAASSVAPRNLIGVQHFVPLLSHGLCKQICWVC